MSFNRQSLLAPICCILAAGLYILARKQEFSRQPHRSRLRRYYSRIDDANNRIWSHWTRETKLRYPERDFNFRQVTLYEDLTYSLAALLYGICVGWIGVLYLTFLHYAELWEMPVWFRGSFFLVTLCRPWTTLWWLWRKGQRTAAAAERDMAQWISLACKMTRAALSVALVAVSVWLFLSSPRDLDIRRDADAWRVCCYASSPRLCEEMTALLNIVAIGRTASLVGCGRMAALYFLWAVGLPVAVRAVILATILAMVVAGLMTRFHGIREREAAEQEGEEEEQDNDESADKRNPQPNEAIDPRLDPRTNAADMRMRAEELVQLANHIATTYAPEEHSAAISDAIQHDRAVDVAQVLTRPMDAAAAQQQPTLNQTVDEYFRFLTPPLSATERRFVRLRVAMPYAEALAAQHAELRDSWQRCMRYCLQGARFGVLLSRVGVAALAQNEALLDAAIANGIVAAESGMLAGARNDDNDFVVTDRDRTLAIQNLPALVQALVLNDHAGGCTKLRDHLQELRDEEAQMRQDADGLVDGTQRLAWKKHERMFFAGLLRKLDAGARRARRERMVNNAAQVQAGISSGMGRGRGRGGESVGQV